jgi:hypothetical protein
MPRLPAARARARQMTRRLRRCCLCGAHSVGAYCWAHSWAAGVSSNNGRRASFSDAVGSPSGEVPLAVPPSAVVSGWASDPSQRQGDNL